MNMSADDGLAYHRWEHRATLSRGFKRYIVFVDNGIQAMGMQIVAPKAYIEELGPGGLKTIDDDSLFEVLHNFAEQKGFLEAQLPIKKQ